MTMPCLHLKDGSTEVYAKLGETTDAMASDLRVSFGGTTYAVCKEALPPVGTPLNDWSWAQISEVAKAGLGSTYFNVGDCKEITLNGKIGDYLMLSNKKLCVFILDMNFPMNGSAENNIIFGCFKSALTNGVDVALVDSNYNEVKRDGVLTFTANHWTSGSNILRGGWKGCDLRYDILGATSTAPSGYGTNPDAYRTGYDATSATLSSPKSNTFLAALPSDLRGVIRLWQRYVQGYNYDGQTNVLASSIDAVTLLTSTEVGTISYGNEPQYNQKLAYYKVNTNQYDKKKHSALSSSADWILSTTAQYSATSFVAFRNGNSFGAREVCYSTGLAPAFKV